MLNVSIDGPTLSGRRGFAAYAATAVEGKSVLAMRHVVFANGTSAVVAKYADGKLYWHNGTAWAEITDLYGGHDTADRGWFYQWCDRLYYFDRNGGTKWHPTAGTWKPGIYRPTTGALIAAAAGGEKHGFYHVHIAFRNSVTKEMSVVTGPSNGVWTSFMDESPTGGLSISNFSAIKGAAADKDYEWNEIVAFCTHGNTERVESPDGEARAECYTYRAYWDASVPSSGSSMGLNKADHVLELRDRFLNSGGTPPGCRFGAFNGRQALYVDVWSGGNSQGGLAMFSIPGTPTAVPQEVTYSAGGDSKTVQPRPWTGQTTTSISAVTGVGTTGNTFVVATKNNIVFMRPADDGRLAEAGTYPACCPSEAGLVQTPSAVHVLADGQWLRIVDGSVEDISDNRFATLLEAMTSAGRAAVCGAYYAYRDEVWFAMPKASGSLCNRILIWSEKTRQIVGVFEPANLGASVGIACMCEMATPGAEPKMLLGLTTGAVLSWPSATYVDVASNYACHWQGHFGQERRATDLTLKRTQLHVGANAAGITLKIAGILTGGQTETLASQTITKTGRAVYGAAQFDPKRMGSMYRVRIESEAGKANWSVHDLILQIGAASERG